MYLKLLVAVAALSASAMSLSASVGTEALQECTAMSDLGKSVMEARQDGLPMSKLMDHFAKSKNTETGQLGTILVEWAFELPRHTTKEGQGRAVSEFESEVYKTCYQSAKKRANSN